MEIAFVIALAVIGEAVIEALKPLFAPIDDLLPESVNLYLYLSVLVALLLVLTYQADAIALLLTVILDTPQDVTFLGMALTAILLGRGSNAIHDLIARLQGDGFDTKDEDND